jgi:hypothetical protein
MQCRIEQCSLKKANSILPIDFSELASYVRLPIQSWICSISSGGNDAGSHATPMRAEEEEQSSEIQ